MTITNIAKLKEVASKGPYIRGTPDWDERELARSLLGNRCISLGTITEAQKRERKRYRAHYHYMNQ